MRQGNLVVTQNASLAVPNLGAPAFERSPVTLSGRLLWPARIGMLVFALLCVYINIMATVDVWNHSVDLTHISEAPGSAASTEQIHAALRDLGLSPVGYAILNVTASVAVVLSFYGTAGYLLRRKSNEVVVLVVVAFLFAMASATAPPDIAILQSAHPTRAVIAELIDGIWLVTFVGLFFLFPDGRFTPRWTLGIVGGYSLLLLDEGLSSSFAWSRTSPLADAIMYAVLLLSVIAAQIYRYRRISGPGERQQTKWFLGGVGIALVTFAVLNVALVDHGSFQAEASIRRAVVAQMLFAIIWVPAQLCIPISLGVAIMRYRLFEIDVVFNRTLVYGGLTASIAGLYALIVVGVGNLLNTGNSLVLSMAATIVVAILFQPLRQRLQHRVNRLLYGDRDDPYAVLTRLGRRLESTLAPDAVLTTIVDTAAEALKLPYVAIALSGSSGTEVVAARGEPVKLPVQFILSNQGEPVGTLLVAPRAESERFSRADLRLLEDMVRHAGPAVQAVRLSTDLQLARERLVLAREEERRRLRRDLHDGLGPRLASLILRIETAREALARDPLADDLLSDLSDRTEEAVTDIRRLVHNLRPPALDDLGLIGALLQTADSYGSRGATFFFDVPKDLPALPAAVEVAALRIAQEAMTNVVRHADAQRCVTRIWMDAGGTTLVIEVEDDGHGVGESPASGMGLRSMRERAEELGGKLQISSTAGTGTRVRAVLPIGSAKNTWADELGEHNGE